MDEDVVFGIQKSSNTFKMDRGTIGCFLSHRSAWSTFLADETAVMCLILEDDVVFADSFNLDDLSRFSADLSPGFVIKLESFKQVTTVSDRPLKTVGEYSSHVLLTTHMGCAAYIIDRVAAKRLIERSFPLRCEVDEFVFETDPKKYGVDIHRIQIVPAPVIQLGNFLPDPGVINIAKSTIEATRKGRIRGLRKFIYRQKRSVNKRVLKLRSLVFDRVQGRTTGIIPFAGRRTELPLST